MLLNNKKVSFWYRSFFSFSKLLSIWQWLRSILMQNPTNMRGRFVKFVYHRPLQMSSIATRRETQNSTKKQMKGETAQNSSRNSSSHMGRWLSDAGSKNELTQKSWNTNLILRKLRIKFSELACFCSQRLICDLKRLWKHFRECIPKRRRKSF